MENSAYPYSSILPTGECVEMG